MLTKKQKNIIFIISTVCLASFVTFMFCEYIFRLKEKASTYGGLRSARHDTLGWLPALGKHIVKTPEYNVTYDVNSFGMNDDPIEESLGISQTRIMVLGDSHTFATGVLQDETWPNVLEKLIFKGDIKEGVVYNCAVIGYSVGQYLIRMRQMAGILKPQIVIIGFSMATDLYDVVGPRHGGFIYGGGSGRIYFDLDNNGNLVELHDLAGKENMPASCRKASKSQAIRAFLEHSVIYRKLKRSRLALWAATYFKPGGDSLWPGLDTGMKIKLSGEDEYRWKLAGALIKEIAKEAHENNIKVVLVNIPYIAKIYDDIWNNSFGLRPKIYDRWIDSQRLGRICEEAKIYYIDSTPKLIREARSKHKWLHYRNDAHPDREGHRIIAEEVFDKLREYGLIYEDLYYNMR